MDRVLFEASSGETTAVLLVVRDGRLYGASVGDSGVLVLTSEASFEPTRGQQRKPLLGSGAASPVGFGPFYFNDRVLVASDGLRKYVDETRIKSIACLGPLATVAADLVAAARLPSGTLQDDVAIALLEPRGPDWQEVEPIDRP
jgi:serine/threonine protein phosphatase PrpC